MKVFDFKSLKRGLFIIKKIEELTGYEAYIVGGAVRDYLFNIYTNDFDIAINIFSTSIYHSRFFKENFKLISFQKYYKSLRAIDKKSGLKFEFTPMRKERYFNRFNPKIKFVDSPEEDFLRRDYTINSLYMNKYMEIIDPCNSLVDLNKLVLRLNENKIGKISEDPKRFLRGLKFINRYNLKLEINTFRILKETKNSINEVSSEYFSSIVDDFFNHLSMSGFRIIKNLNLFDFFSYEKCVNISEIRKIKCFDLRLFGFIFLYSYEKSIVFNMIINSKYVKKSTKVLFKDFCFYLSKLNSDFYDVITSILDKYGLDVLKDFYELSRILNDYYILTIKIDKFSKIIHNIVRGKLPSSRREVDINGDDLIKLGVKPGSQIGEIINALNILVLKGEKNEKDNLLRLAYNLMPKEVCMKKYFGTDGARGIANLELTNEFAYKTGRAIVRYLNKENPVIVVGMDTRLSSRMLQMSVMAGIIAEGGTSIDLGILPTPAVAYIARTNNFDMGVMISASHNPYEYNGIKLIGGDGYKLKDEIEIEIENIIDSIQNDEHAYDGIGKYLNGEEFKENYINHIKSIPKNSFKGLKIGVDAGDGVMSYFAKNILTSLGAEVKAIYSDGDGRHINDNSGSTSPEKVADLVKINGLDIGVSFDGDADRVIFSDELGNVLDGDHIIAYAAKNYLKNNILINNGVVTTTMSNGAFEKYLIDEGINLLRADVGDRYVMEGMREKDYVIGGEKSGHIIFLDHNTMGDGIQTAVIIIDMLIENKEKASVIGNSFTDYPQVLVNAKADENLKKTFRENEKINKAISELYEIHPDYRVLIRPSGTEKYVRIMIEGRDIEEIEKEANKIKEVIEREE